MFVFSYLQKIHTVSGCLALSTFALPIILKKGGKLHARFGWAYVFGMAGVAVTSIIMALMRLFLDQDLSEQQRDFSIFLLMIAIFTASAVWSGLQVLAWKGPCLGRQPFHGASSMAALSKGIAVEMVY